MTERRTRSEKNREVRVIQSRKLIKIIETDSFHPFLYIETEYPSVSNGIKVSNGFIISVSKVQIPKIIQGY